MTETLKSPFILVVLPRFKPGKLLQQETESAAHTHTHIPAEMWVCGNVCVCVFGSAWMEQLWDSSQRWAGHPGNLILFINNKTSIVKKKRERKKKPWVLTHVLPGCQAAWLPALAAAPLYIYYSLSLCVSAVGEKARGGTVPLTRPGFSIRLECRCAAIRALQELIHLFPFFTFCQFPPLLHSVYLHNKWGPAGARRLI